MASSRVFEERRLAHPTWMRTETDTTRHGALPALLLADRAALGALADAACPWTHRAPDRITRLLLSNTTVDWWIMGLTMTGSEQGEFAGYSLDHWTVVLKRASCQIEPWLLVGPSATGQGIGVYTIRPVAIGEVVFDPHDMPQKVRASVQPKRSVDVGIANLQRELGGAMRSLKAVPAVAWTARALADVQPNELLLSA